MRTCVETAYSCETLEDGRVLERVKHSTRRWGAKVKVKIIIFGKVKKVAPSLVQGCWSLLVESSEAEDTKEEGSVVDRLRVGG